MVAASSPADLDDTIRVRLQTLSPLAATIVKNPRATLVPTSDTPPHSGKSALAALRKIQHDPAALHIEDKLGEGGMGVVHTGRQVSLDRRVAVKTLRAEHVCDENVEGLLGEAWLVGSLEHPNVIPVYDLGLDETGAPLLVMKRIEGDTWADLLFDPQAMKRHAQGGDLLEFHLRVLIQVCNAMHFAHSRNVVHRDLKPDNVMIGDFGEVYVLDWGVAMRPGPVRHVAGTIVYMAPEMLGGLGDVTARTDVYLLGALLYEVLTGHAPHEGENMAAMVSSVVLSSPKLADALPDELAALVVRCMKRDPEERPESALAVRRSIELFLEHRGAMALAAEAHQRLGDLEALLSAKNVEIDRAYNVLGACRFGFRQALRAWADAPDAKDGMHRALACMIRFEAERGDASAAARLLAELDERDAKLEAVVAEAQREAAEQQQKIEKLQKLEKDLDPREGRRLRLAAGLGFGLLWTLVPLFAPQYVASHPRHEGFVMIPVDLICLCILALAWLRRAALTRINRQLLSAFAFGVGAQPLVVLAALYTLHIDHSKILWVATAHWFIVMGVMAASIERRLLPLSLAYGAAFFGVREFPDHRYLVVTLANLVAVVTVASIWTQRATERAIERDRIREETGKACG